MASGACCTAGLQVEAPASRQRVIPAVEPSQQGLQTLPQAPQSESELAHKYGLKDNRANCGTT